MSRHPGPPRPEPFLLAPARAVPVALDARAGDDLLDLAGALLGHAEAGWLRLTGAAFDRLDYVGPDWPDPEGLRAAWYSETRRPATPARADLTVIVGRKDGAPWLHGHGTITGADGAETFGHVLPGRCRLAADARIEATALTGAAWAVAPCPETGFDLFHPSGGHGALDAAPDAAIVKLNPGADLLPALRDACAAAGFARARVEGLGSLERTVFEDGRVMESMASEFAVTGGHVAPREARVEIRITGRERQVMDGALAATGNPTLVTCELLLLREEG